MDKAERTLAFEVQFWGLIAPLIPLVTLFVILLKMPSQGIYLSLASIIGFLAAWKWKRKGVLISLAAILFGYLYQYSEITPDEHLWHVGMNLSILLGFFIAGGCFEEVEKLLTASLEKDEAVVEEVGEEVTALKTRIMSYEQLVESTKDEIVKINQQHEILLKEYFQKQTILSTRDEELFLAKNELKKLDEKVLALEAEIAQQKLLKAKEAPFQIKNGELVDQEAFDQLKNTNELLSRERGRLESLLFRSQIELHQKNQDLAGYEAIAADFDLWKGEKALLEQTIQEAEYRESDLQNRIYELAKEREAFYSEQKKEVKETKAETEIDYVELKKEEPEIFFDLRKMEGKYQQLREQFEEKSEVLNEVRRELFQKEEAILALKLQITELELYDKSQKEVYLEGYLLEVMSEKEEKIERLNEEIEALHAIIEKLNESK